jgi:molybdopterin-binding protein
MTKSTEKPKHATVRIGEAAEVLGVSVDTLRRWESSGQLRVSRTKGGQRLVALSEVRRLQAGRRQGKRERAIVAQSARNRFPGIVTKVERDRVAAVVEVQAGQFRLVSLMTAEAAEELAFRPGMPVVCVVKATNVVVEIARGTAAAH